MRKLKKRNNVLSRSESYLIDSKETSCIQLPDKFDCVNWSLSPDNLVIDKATVNQGLGRTVSTLNDVFLVQSLSTIVLVQVEHTDNIVDRAADEVIPSVIEA